MLGDARNVYAIAGRLPGPEVIPDRSSSYERLAEVTLNPRNSGQRYVGATQAGGPWQVVVEKTRKPRDGRDWCASRQAVSGEPRAPRLVLLRIGNNGKPRSGTA